MTGGWAKVWCVLSSTTASVTDALWLADHSNRCLNATLSDDHSRQFRAALALIGGFMRTRSPAPASVGAN